MSTLGGFREISTLSTESRPISQTMGDSDDDETKDVESTSVSALLEEEDHYSEDGDRNTPSKPERQYSRSPSPLGNVREMAGVKPINVSPTRGLGVPRKSILKSLKTDRVKLLSRLRVVFRMFSLITAGTALGSTAHILYHYVNTQNLTNSEGGDLWGQISLAPTVLLLCIGAYIFIVDTIFSVVSFWPNGRYLRNKILASVALLHSIVSLICGIVALELSEEKRHPKSMFFCDAGPQSPADLQIIDFSLYCSEQRGAWVSACICTVAHGLIIPTILFGFCAGRSKRQRFQDAIIVREPEAKGSVLQRLGDLKDKFISRN